MSDVATDYQVSNTAVQAPSPTQAVDAAWFGRASSADALQAATETIQHLSTTLNVVSVSILTFLLVFLSSDSFDNHASAGKRTTPNIIKWCPHDALEFVASSVQTGYGMVYSIQHQGSQRTTRVPYTNSARCMACWNATSSSTPTSTISFSSWWMKSITS